MKKAEEYLDSFAEQFQFKNNGFIYMSIEDMIKQAQLDMLEYAVTKCAENTEIKYGVGVCCQECGYGEIDEQSVLKTIDQIKEEMK